MTILMTIEKDWIDIMSALLVPTIAIVAMVVGVLQFRINKARLKHELFDKRYAQFAAVRDFLGSIMRNGAATEEEQRKYLIGTAGLSFLFSQELQSFLHKKVWGKAIDLETVQAQFKDMSVGKERTKLVHEAAEIKKQIPTILKEVAERFAPYIQLTH